MAKKKKKITWNKRCGKIMSSKFLKPRRDPRTDIGKDGICREALFKKIFNEKIKQAAST